MQYLVKDWDNNLLAHFLKCLRSWAIIYVDRKNLAEDYNNFSSITIFALIFSRINCPALIFVLSSVIL